MIPSIQAVNISYEVNDVDTQLKVLNGLSFALTQGDTTAIVGASGCGKTTFLSILAGLVTPSSGQVRLLGTDLFTLSEDARASFRAKNIGFVFQNFELLPRLRVIEQVLLMQELAGLPYNTNEALALLNEVGLSKRDNSYPEVLSSGERQRVAIARALVHNPQIIFADEPTSSLDHATGKRIADLLFGLAKNQHTSMLLVTHDPSLAQKANTTFHLSQGKFVT